MLVALLARRRRGETWKGVNGSPDVGSVGVASDRCFFKFTVV